jgi:hypothetical protein
MHTTAIRLYTCAVLAAIASFAAAPAYAQYQPRPISNPATGESYHFEFGIDYWSPDQNITVSSAGSGALTGIVGSNINATRDLGFTNERFPAIQVQLRPSKRSKFRFQYIPISYTASTTLATSIVFNGIRYNLGVPVNSTLDWKAYRIGYEYDFISRDRGYLGILAEVKYTDVRVELDSPFAQEFARAQGPIPALGLASRVYVMPNIAISGEVSAFDVPSSISTKYNAHYVDFDVYGTLNFTNNIGVKGGYRSTDVAYLFNNDTGSLTLNGFYIGAVVRY